MSSDSKTRAIIESAGQVATLLTDLMDHLDVLIGYWDIDQRCRLASRAYLDWFGRSNKEMIGISLRELLGTLYKLNLPQIEAAYRGEPQLFERSIPFPDGVGVRYSLASYIPRFMDGQVIGVFVHVSDVSPLKRLAGC
jgi:PAS domain S-box-containing protein